MACSSVHASRGSSVCSPHKRYNFILKRPFFTRFAWIPCRAPHETSENIHRSGRRYGQAVPLGDRAGGQAMNALNHIAQ